MEPKGSVIGMWGYTPVAITGVLVLMTNFRNGSNTVQRDKEHNAIR